MEGRQHHQAPGVLRRPDRRRVGTQRRDVLWPADRRTAPHGTGARSAQWSQHAHDRRRRGHGESVQRRGHRLRLRDRSASPPRSSPRRCSRTTPRSSASTTSDSRAAYGDYFKVARAFVRIISDPKILTACVGVGLRIEPLMNELLAIMANLMRNDKKGPAELGYRALLRLVRRHPRARLRHVVERRADQGLRLNYTGLDVGDTDARQQGAREARDERLGLRPCVRRARRGSPRSVRR